MLPLDSPRWNELKQAYGTAEDIPDLIQTLADEPGPDDWNELWGCLCHQMSVYSATYAAFPHLLEIARNRPAGERFDLILFLGTVAAHRDDAALLPEFREDYGRALPEAAEMCLAELMAGPDDQGNAVYLILALAGLCGCTGVARSIDGFVDAEFLIECPGCQTELYIWPSDEGYRIYSEDPVKNRATPFSAVKPAPIAGIPGTVTPADIREETAPQWISSVATSGGHSELAALLQQLHGTGSCPKCHCEFSVFEEVLKNPR